MLGKDSRRRSLHVSTGFQEKGPPPKKLARRTLSVWRVRYDDVELVRIDVFKVTEQFDRGNAPHNRSSYSGVGTQEKFEKTGQLSARYVKADEVLHTSSDELQHDIAHWPTDLAEGDERGVRTSLKYTVHHPVILTDSETSRIDMVEHGTIRERTHRVSTLPRHEKITSRWPLCATITRCTNSGQRQGWIKLRKMLWNQWIVLTKTQRDNSRGQEEA